MDTLEAGFWGAFFGAAGLMLTASLAMYARSQLRPALMAAVTAVFSALFVASYLGWLPVEDPQAKARLVAHIAAAAAAVLGLLQMSMLGLLRQPEHARRAYWLTLVPAALAMVVGWTLSPRQSLVLGTAMPIGVSFALLGLTLRSALRGDRLAWVAFSALSLMFISLLGLSWIALVPDAHWLVSALSASTGGAYLALTSYALWSRYAYLLELAEAMANGPRYDPVTRMRSYNETAQMVDDAFQREEGDLRAVGVVVISIANLFALESLHGRAAFTHALFVCANRLRRCVPEDVQVGRLSHDGFVLLMRDAGDMQALVELARHVRRQLSRELVLGTTRGATGVAAPVWAAEVGLGVLAAGPHMSSQEAIGSALAMSRSAWAYDSRLAWYDEAVPQIAELPLKDHK